MVLAAVNFRVELPGFGRPRQKPGNLSETTAGNIKGLVALRQDRDQEASISSRRASSVASANSQFRNIVTLGTFEVTFGQTIQYVLDVSKDTSIGLTRRPPMRYQAASAVRASATPWPSTAASINMLARLRTGP